MRDSDSLKFRLAAVVKKQRAALDRLGVLLTNPDATRASIEDAQALVERFAAQYQRLIQELKLAELEKTERFGSHNSRSGQRPMRELVLDILDEIGVPCSPGTLSECAAVWTGIQLPASRFASLRRDEQVAFGRDSQSRPAWLVPALNAFGFRAIPRSLACSVWESERRLIGPRTLRVNHLRILLALLRRLGTLRQSGSSAQEERLSGLLQRYARSVPGALTTGEDSDLDQIRQAAEGELDAIELLDGTDRKNAAVELQKLPAHQQLWGLPAVIEGRAAVLRKAAGR
jgi:hypothetical protein